MNAILTRQEAADYLGISTDTLDRLRSAGRIVGARISARLVRFRRDELDAYLTQCQTQPSSRSTPPPSGTSNGGKMDGRAALQLARQIAQRQRRS